MSPKKHFYFYRFSPVTKPPTSMRKNAFKGWWDNELQHNNAEPVDEGEFTNAGPVGGENLTENLRIYKLWSELRRAHSWLMNRL